MFKLKERGLAEAYQLDRSDANKNHIVTGAILVAGENGLRLVTSSDNITGDNSKYCLFACDPYQNTRLASIYGHPEANEERITAVPISEKFEFSYDFDYNVERGDRFTIENGNIVPATKGDAVVFVAVEGTWHNHNEPMEAVLTTVIEKHISASELYPDGGSGDITLAIGEVDGQGVPQKGYPDGQISITLSEGSFKEDEADVEENWTVDFGASNDGASFTILDTIINEAGGVVGVIMEIAAADTDNLESGSIEISVIGNAIQGIDYDPAVQTFIIQGYSVNLLTDDYLGHYHGANETLMLSTAVIPDIGLAGDDWNEEYQVLKADEGDTQTVLSLKKANREASDIVDECNLFIRSVAKSALTATLGEDGGTIKLTDLNPTGIGASMKVYIPWDNAGTTEVSVYDINTVESDHLVLTLDTAITGNIAAPYGEHENIEISYNVDGKFSYDITAEA
jgi:hypothetical protein